MKLNNKRIKQVLIGTYSGWCGLGYWRGNNSYKFDKEKNKKTLFYSGQLTNGLLGFLFYANPVLFPYFLYKEMYRLEVNLRNLEEEKKGYFYNELH